MDIKWEIPNNTTLRLPLTFHIHQWTDHLDRKEGNTDLKWRIRPDGLNWYS